MCGISGFLRIGGTTTDSARILTAMTDAIANRGPDDSGAWLDADSGVALGQRRLSVIDLSPAGHQPMSSHSQRYVVTYNGEIYNYRELREQLQAEVPSLSWRGHSDTEVMLACFDRWGVEEALKRLNGMFAMAVWDRTERALILARDRMGEKPLYYGLMGRSILFGSELKALQAHPDFSATVDREALALFLRYGYIPAPRSIWRGVSKIPAAHYVRIEADGRIGPPITYWDFAAVAAAGAANPCEDIPSLVDETEALLKDAVGLRMEADVPLGAFLSGGIDSSLVVSLMQAQSSKPVRTFTIGFHDRDFNEAEHAKAVAAHLGCEHTELYVSAKDALVVVPDLPAMWDEPFADSSQIPTFLVSQMTRQAVTVSLSGDGGDELFGGYTRYVSAVNMWNRAKRLPGPVRKMLAASLQEPTVVRGISAAAGLLPTRYRPMALGERIPKIGQLMNEPGPDAVYRRLVSLVPDPERYLAGGDTIGELEHDTPAFADFRQKMMYLDTITYLPDDVMVKVDRASMAVSLEGRAPFLDHRVVEAAWRLPMSTKIRNGAGKAVLRDILHRHIPRELMERPKMGFAIPVSDWLAGPLRSWAEDLLDPTRLKREGFLNEIAVRALWDAHCAGCVTAHRPLWNILMFQAWWDFQQKLRSRRTDRAYALMQARSG